MPVFEGKRVRAGRSGAVGPPSEPPAEYEDLAERVRGFPRQRTYLLPALTLLQAELGWLPAWAVEFAGAHLRVPKSEAYGVASSFPELRLEEPPAHVLRICTGASCRALGALDLRRRLDGFSGEVTEADCLFVCGVGPAVELDGRVIGRAQPDRLLLATQPPTSVETASAGITTHERTQSGVDPATVGGPRAGGLTTHERSQSGAIALIQDGGCSRSAAASSAAASGQRGTPVGCAGNCWQAPAVSVDGGETWTSVNGGEIWRRPGEIRLLANAGRVDPLVVGRDAYGGLEKALSMGSNAVWELVKSSGLRGRGGAYFPVGAKWETARNTPAEKKFLLVNAEEGEPGIYKDRHLLEGDPHRVIEGIQIAALGIGATQVFVFVNGEAHLAQARLLAALERARERGAVRVPIEVRLGAGGYVLGEETVLINAIHGYRSEPLARPPFPAVSGLQASPTVINNVESLANLPAIVLNGPDWFRSTGSPETPGTKLVSLAGGVRRPGLYEAPLGTPIRTIIDDYGGGTRGELKAILAGGPSGSVLPASLADTPLDVHTLTAVGGILGAGGLVPLDEKTCVVRAVRELAAYNARESCGKCTPCREGNPRMVGLFDDLEHGRASQSTLDTIDYVNDLLAFGSLCGLGQMAPNPVRSLLRHFDDEVREHLNHECRAGACSFEAEGQQSWQ